MGSLVRDIKRHFSIFLPSLVIWVSNESIQSKDYDELTIRDIGSPVRDIFQFFYFLQQYKYQMKAFKAKITISRQ